MLLSLGLSLICHCRLGCTYANFSLTVFRKYRVNGQINIMMNCVLTLWYNVKLIDSAFSLEQLSHYGHQWRG